MREKEKETVRQTEKQR